MTERESNTLAQQTPPSVPPPAPVDPNRGSPTLVLGIFIVLAVAAGLIAGTYFHHEIGHVLGLATDAPGAADGKKKLWTCGMHPQVIQDKPGLCPICGMALEPIDAGASAAPAKTERKIKYWWDPMMNPPYIADKPGKSPMGMDLVPVYEDEVSAGTAIHIDPVIVQNMGVRTAKIAKGPIHQAIRAVGYLEEAQPNIVDINLRVSGWIEKLQANTEGMHIQQGQPLFELYSPELQVAVEELIIARRAAAALPKDADDTARSNAAVLQQTAHRKLEQWGLTPQQVNDLAKLDRAPRAIPFLSPVTGDVTEKMVVEGASVESGMRILRIVDHSTLWLDAQIHAQDLPSIKLGQKITAKVEGIAAKQFEGEVIFLHPHIDTTTRTAKVRMALPNANHTLRPGMYATVLIDAKLADDALQIPREAVLDTGTRQVVFVALPDGHFEPRQVKTGVESHEGNVQILQGLAPNETVVTSGQFLMDSESRMKEAIEKHLSGKLMKPAAQPAEPAHANHASSTQPAPSLGHGHWTSAVDATVAAYLELANRLGAPQTDATPLNPAKLESAAKTLLPHVPNDQAKSLVESVIAAAAALRDQPLDQQRKLFSPLSNALIALVEQLPPSVSVAPKLYLVHCPMAPGSWLQTTAAVANPYYATEMKPCGEVEREISLSQPK